MKRKIKKQLKKKSKSKPKTENYLYLKFGRIKGGDFINSPESLEVYNRLIDDESKTEYKEAAYKCIELFNGVIYNWWLGENVSKEEAKMYIKNYKHTT